MAREKLEMSGPKRITRILLRSSPMVALLVSVMGNLEDVRAQCSRVTKPVYRYLTLYLLKLRIAGGQVRFALKSERGCEAISK